MQMKETWSAGRSMRRARSFFTVFAILIVSLVALVIGASKTLQLNATIRNSEAVHSTETRKFTSVYTDNKGERFPRYNIEFTYMVSGATITQSQEVNQGFYNQFSGSQPLIVYYDRGDPYSALIDLDGLYGQSRWMLVLGLGGTIFCVFLLVFLYYLTFSRGD